METVRKTDANTNLLPVEDKHAAELILANKELLFQNEEKEKRANELAIANKELLFQNEEKEKRANELAIANKELFFLFILKNQFFIGYNQLCCSFFFLFVLK